MIVLAVQVLRLATAALPLLLSARAALPTVYVEPIAYRAKSAASSVLDLVGSVERAGAFSSSAQAGSGSDGSRPAAGAALQPPVSASASDTGNTGTKPRSKSQKSGAKSAGATGSTGASGASGDEAGSTASSSEGDPASSRGTSGDEDDRDDDSGRVREDGHGPEPPGMHRSSTPDVSFGSSPVHVAADEYHRGNIVCIGGEVTIDGEVRGDVVVVGGVLTISGTVRGDAVAVASKVHLTDTAVLKHDFVSVSGPVDRAGRARIGGEYHSVDLPNLGRFATGHGVFLYLMSLFLWIGIIVTALRFMAVLVVAAIAPGRVEGALASPRVSWTFAFFLGFVVHLFAGLIGLILVLGIVTSPIGFALWLGVRVVVWMGLAAIYLEIGRNFSKTVFGNRLSYFGSILVGFAIFAVIGMIPIVGWFVSGIMSSTALGLMLLTRFGGRARAPVIAPSVPVGPYPPATPTPSSPPSPPIAPAGPVGAPPAGAAPESAG